MHRTLFVFLGSTSNFVVESWVNSLPPPRVVQDLHHVIFVVFLLIDALTLVHFCVCKGVGHYTNETKECHDFSFWHLHRVECSHEQSNYFWAVISSTNLVSFLPFFFFFFNCMNFFQIQLFFKFMIFFKFSWTFFRKNYELF